MLIKHLITARPLYLTLNAINTVINIFNGALYRRATNRILGVSIRNNSRSASYTRILIISDSVGIVVVV